MKIIQLYDNLEQYGGAENVLYKLHQNLYAHKFDVMISSMTSYNNICIKNSIKKDIYIKFNIFNLKEFKNSIVISHSRKMTTYLIFLNKLLCLNIKIIHVAHNVSSTKKYLTLLPKNIIAVSYAVKRKLVDSFRIPETNIEVIYNGIEDQMKKFEQLSYKPNEEIKIVLIGRVETVKQQTKIVEFLANKINKKIKIDFVGTGSQVNRLEALIAEKGKKNFNYIGFNNQISKLIENYHFVLLFSENEGLGLSLIEGCMMGKPLIARGIEGNEACSEVCIDGFNGFITNTFDELINTLNNLQNISATKYQEFSVNSRKHFIDKFQEEVMVNSYINYLGKIKNDEK